MRQKVFKSIIVIGASLLVVALIFVTAYKVYGNSRLQRAASAYQKDVGSLDATSYAPISVQETQNIAQWVTAGAYGFVVEYKDRELMNDLLSTPYDKWQPEKVAKFRELSKRNEGAFQILDQSRDLDRSSFGLNYKTASDLQFPKLTYFLQARKLLACKWRIDLADGKLEDVIRTAEILERMSAALVHEPVRMSVLVGHVAEKEYHDLIHEILPKMDVDSLSRISATLKHLDKMTAPIHKILAAEGALQYQSVAGKKSSDEEEDFETPIPSDKKVNFFDDRLFLAISLEQYTNLSRNSKIPVKTFSVQSAEMNIPIYDEIFRDSFNTWQKVIERFQATQSAQILAAASIRLCLEASSTGKYPNDLSHLPLGQSPYTGENAQYVLFKDGSAEISFPVASDFWDGRNKGPVPQKPRFRWKLLSPQKH